MTRGLTALAVLLSLSVATPCMAQSVAGAQTAELDPENLALANQIIDLAYPPSTRHAMMMRTSEAMMAQARSASLDAWGENIDAGAQQILQRFFERVRAQSERSLASDSAPLFTAFARAYARRFTRDELMGIRAFAATPAGARFFQLSSELLSDPDVAQANTAYMTRAFEAMRPLMEDLDREMREYARANERRTRRRR